MRLVVGTIFVSIPALIAAPFAFVLLLLVKMLTKFVGVFPMTKAYRSPPKESMYTTLLMSTRAHLRHHLRPVRPIASCHRPEPIFRVVAGVIGSALRAGASKR